MSATNLKPEVIINKNFWEPLADSDKATKVQESLWLVDYTCTC